MISFHTASVASVSLFFAILFLQSGLDKVFDWKGNFEFHMSHFADSPLRKMAPFMLVIITIIEVSCGILSLAGLIYFFLENDSSVSFYACCLASLNFLALFFGQRLSKDYKGAATLVPYFILALAGMYITFS